MKKTEDGARRRQDILEYLQWYQKTRYYCPTIQEVADHFGMGASTAYYHLGVLRKEGRVDWQEGIPRTLTTRGERHGTETTSPAEGSGG